MVVLAPPLIVDTSWPESDVPGEAAAKLASWRYAPPAPQGSLMTAARHCV
jgi:hypothetical protein